MINSVENINIFTNVNGSAYFNSGSNIGCEHSLNLENGVECNHKKSGGKAVSSCSCADVTCRNNYMSVSYVMLSIQM